MKLYRIQAYTARYLYLYKRSLPRLMEVFYWPLVDLFVWGFITVYLSAYKGALPDFVGFFLGALILWDMLFRCQQGITVSFLEDMWSRNLLNIFVSPLSPGGIRLLASRDERHKTPSRLKRDDSRRARDFTRLTSFKWASLSCHSR